ncbi:MAG: cell division protein FtsB [marine bacterium B5-7]|nr:MAG: cell division protein FtsB [marine bacterium B5-7]
MFSTTNLDTASGRRVSRFWPALLTAVLVFVQVVLWTGQNGVLEYINLKGDVDDAVARNERLSERNQTLLEDVVDIKSRDEAVEELARTRLGMIRKGEQFYQIVERP